MRPDQEIADGIKLGAIAVASAVVTAMLVIGAGRTLLPEIQTRDAARPAYVQVSMP